MLPIRLRAILGPALTAALLTGCENSQPGGGFTNGPPPIAAPENPAVRSDVPLPATPDQGEAFGRATASDPSGSGTSGGTAARGGGQRGDAIAQPKVDAGGPDVVPANPPVIESTSPAGAAGDTRPAGDIKVGTPQTPQA